MQLNYIQFYHINKVGKFWNNRQITFSEKEINCIYYIEEIMWIKLGIGLKNGKTLGIKYEVLYIDRLKAIKNSITDFFYLFIFLNLLYLGF